MDNNNEELMDLLNKVLNMVYDYEQKHPEHKGLSVHTSPDGTYATIEHSFRLNECIRTCPSKYRVIASTD